MSLKAKLTPTVYSITYNLNGGTNGKNPETYAIETSTIAPADASNAGYIFIGRYADF